MHSSKHEESAKNERYKIPEQELMRPQTKPFAEVLESIPNVGRDSDFEHLQDDDSSDVSDMEPYIFERVY